MKQLKKKIIIKGVITALTGLHIGGTNNELSIGGMDNAVIRNPVTQEPYIPGSSLKGKMRSLLEVAEGLPREAKKMGRDIFNPPTNDPHYLGSLLFGYTQYDEEKKTGRKIEVSKWKFPPQRPSRVIVRDCKLTNADQLGQHMIEEKSETVIDRITSAAMPRQMERVPAGAEFEMEMIVNVFEADDEEKLVKGVLEGLSLVQDDYLGGAGSRGSGQVRFTIHSMKERDTEYYKGNGNGAGKDLLSIYQASYSDLITFESEQEA